VPTTEKNENARGVQVISGQATREVFRAALTTALVFIVATRVPVPVVGIFMIPLPALYYRLKLGRQMALAATAGAVILWRLVLGVAGADLFVFLEQLVLGLVLGECLDSGLSIEKAVGISAGAALAAGVGILFYYAQDTGVGLKEFISTHITADLNLYRDFFRDSYKDMGVPQESLETLSIALDHARYILIRTLPGLWAAMALVGAWACLLMARPWLRAGKLAMPALESLNRWKAPEPLVWGLIGCGILMLIPSSDLRIVGVNGLYIVLTAYFFQGIAIVSHQFEKRRVPRILRWFLYSLILIVLWQPILFFVMFQPLLFFVIGLGIFDMWLDIRRLKQPTETNGVS